MTAAHATVWTPVVLVLRVLVVAGVLAAMRWSARGLIEMTRGGFNPPAMYLSVVFWFAAAALSFQMAWYFGASDLWRICSLTLLLVALALAELGHRHGSALKARQFYRLYDHLAETQAIADLANVDPGQAARIADECRALTAAAMLTRHG